MGDIKTETLPLALRSRCHVMGFVESDNEKVKIYNAVDATVVPALQESLSVVASDSLCCGTPVIAFATSGLEEFVEHKKNGYLAQPYKIEDLVCGINWVCIEQTKDRLLEYSRKSAVKLFDSEKNTQKYIDLLTDVASSFQGIELNLSEVKMMKRTFDFLEARLESRHQHIRYLEKTIDAMKTEERPSSVLNTPYTFLEKTGNSQTDFAVANCYLRNGNYTEAIAIYQKLDLANPRDIYKMNIQIAQKKLNEQV
jgi:tetratricopeptide (TPR) repeat protein